MYRSNLLSRELGLVLVAFCAGLTLYFIYSVYFPKASIVINKDGIKQKAMRGKGPIKWEKISEIYICVIPKKKYDTYFLGIKYRKDENDTRKVKFKGKVDQKIGDAVLVIDELEMQPYDIYNNIQKYMRSCSSKSKASSVNADCDNCKSSTSIISFSMCNSINAFILRLIIWERSAIMLKSSLPSISENTLPAWQCSFQYILETL